MLKARSLVLLAALLSMTGCETCMGFVCDGKTGGDDSYSGVSPTASSSNPDAWKPQLPSPKNLRVENDAFLWDLTYETAYNYPTFDVQVTDSNETEIVHRNDISFAASGTMSLPLIGALPSSGTYTFAVYAFPSWNGAVVRKSETIQMKTEITLSDQPLNLVYSSEKKALNWSNTSTFGYTLSLDEAAYDVHSNSYPITFASGKHTAKVASKGNGGSILSSEYTSLYSFSFLGQPTGLARSGSKVVWNSVEGVSYYEVYNFGQEVQKTTDPIYLLSESTTEYDLTVQAMGDNLNTFAGPLSDEFKFSTF